MSERCRHLLCPNWLKYYILFYTANILYVLFSGGGELPSESEIEKFITEIKKFSTLNQAKSEFLNFIKSPGLTNVLNF